MEDSIVHDSILIKNFKVRVLFNSRCTHSFIAVRIVKRLRLEIIALSYPLLIVSAKGEPECTTLGLNNLEFEI